jgi:putative ABC transport system permease protein
MVLLGSVALLALCLAAAGIYAVVSYAVTRRTREIGVRIALGATPLSVQRLVVWQGSLPAAAGGIVGLLAAVAIAFVSAGSMPEVDVRNPASYGIVVVCLAVVAVGASYLPARRASRIDPAITLRAE